MAWRSVCYKNNIRNQEVVHQVKEFTRSVQHGKKNLSTLAGTQCVDRTWRTLKHYLPKKKLMKDPTQSPCVPFSNTKSTHGLGVRTWASCLQRSFCGSSPKFGEQHSSLLTLCRREKTEFLPRVFAKSHRKRNKNHNGISMISASHGTHQMATFPHGEIWAVNLVHIKIAGKWMFIPLKMVFIGIDPHPYPVVVWFRSPGSPVISRPHRPRRATWRRCFFESRTEPEGRGGDVSGPGHTLGPWRNISKKKQWIQET